MSQKAVLIIGGGIAGIQSAIDLANMGNRVYLVEKNPSIGGRMAQLDKTFPTNDCAMCILAPKMIECANHENITLLTYSEVAGIEGRKAVSKPGSSRKPVLLRKTNVWAAGSAPRSAPQKSRINSMRASARERLFTSTFPRPSLPPMSSIPSTAGSSRERNAVFVKRPVRPRRSTTSKRTRKSFSRWEPSSWPRDLIFTMYPHLTEYGWGKIANVLTAMQFERMICASGPTQGHLKRPSDGKEPKTLAFIQCVGSRDVRHKRYCSAVCCMHATKEAILAHEHYPNLSSTIFFMDMRAVGKGFQDYIQRAKTDYAVEYIRARPGRITENEESKNPVIQFEDTTTQELKSREFDMVILAQAMQPSESNAAVAQQMGVSLDEFGFVAPSEDLLNPFATSRGGVFACGFCQSPMDVPDSVVRASAAASKVAEVLASCS